MRSAFLDQTLSFGIFTLLGRFSDVGPPRRGASGHGVGTGPVDSGWTVSFRRLRTPTSRRLVVFLSTGLLGTDI